MSSKYVKIFCFIKNACECILILDTYQLITRINLENDDTVDHVDALEQQTPRRKR
jgi:hypothetical protein